MAIFGERERWSHRGRGYVKMETEWSDVATSRSRKKLGIRVIRSAVAEQTYNSRLLAREQC